MNYEYLGENIQKIRKYKGLTQQELADKIGVKMQSLSKIERGINHPTYETFEKILDVLDITPNQLLSGELKTSANMENEIVKFLRKEIGFNAELDFWEVDTPIADRDTDPDALGMLRKYIQDFISSDKRRVAELREIKEFIQYKKFQKILSLYEDYLCHDLYSETLRGRKNPNPYRSEEITYNAKNNDGDNYIYKEYPDDFED